MDIAVCRKAAVIYTASPFPKPSLRLKNNRFVCNLVRKLESFKVSVPV